jgi:hypothetical protein
MGNALDVGSGTSSDDRGFRRLISRQYYLIKTLNKFIYLFNIIIDKSKFEGIK